MNPTSSRFVVVDDGEEDAILLTRLLEKSGASAVTVYGSGEEAMAAFQAIEAGNNGTTFPAAAFIDVNMPGVDGFDVLKWIRQSDRLQSVVVVLLSGTGEPRNIGKASQLRADCYLVKFPSPSAMRELIAAIQSMSAIPLPRPVVPVPGNLLVAAAAR